MGADLEARLATFPPFYHVPVTVFGGGPVTMFNSLLEGRTPNRQVFVVDSTPPGPEKRDQETSRVIQHVTRSLSPKLEAMSVVEQPEPADPNRTFGGLGTADQLYRHATVLLEDEWQLGTIGGHFPILTGDTIISPPYAGEWHVGGGDSLGASGHGSVTTFGASGVSAAGINVSLRSDSSDLVSAAITPVGTYSFSWIAFEDLPSLQTQGGLSVAIYVDDQLLMQRDAVLWTQSGATQLGGQSGEGQIADASSPAFGFGPVPIGPVLIDMMPSRRYVLTLWCWQIAQYPENAAFLSLSGMTMPAVRIGFGPPTFIG